MDKNNGRQTSMENTNTTGSYIKAARPDDAALAAELIFDTDPHVFGYWFNGTREKALKYFAFQWKSMEGSFSHIFARGAFNGGNLVGIEAGYDRQTQHREGRAFFRQAETLLENSEFDHFSRSLNYMAYLNPPIARDAYYIQTLSVSKERKNEGIGKLLIQSAFERAAKEGYRSCHLDVAGDNPAVDFYLHMGMEVLCEMRTPFLEHYNIPRHYRMVKYF